MLIRLEPRLEYIKAMQAGGEQPPVKGTLAVINGNLDFRRTDGYIQFMELALAYIPGVYGEQDPGWQVWLDKICSTAEKLQDDAVRFTGNTEKEFKAYCENLSGLMGRDAPKPLPPVGLDIFTEDDLATAIEKQIARGISKGFLFDGEDMGKWLAKPKGMPGPKLARLGIADDVMMCLSGLKMGKSGRMYGISYHLREPGYHENVIDALNMLIQAAVYAVNCSSTKQGQAFGFDIQEIRGRLGHVGLLL